MSTPKLRSRGFSDIRTGLKLDWTGNPGHPFTHLPSTWKSFRRYEYINDVVGTPKTQRVKPVEHVKARYEGLAFQDFFIDGGTRLTFFGEDSLPYIDIEHLLGLDMFLIPHSKIVIANQDAFNSFSDRFPAKISFAEFAQGLFELKALLPKLERSITQTLSSNYLTKKFGWDNLISDLNQFSSLVGSIRERMEFLKKTYGKPTKLYFKRPNIHTVDSFVSDFEPERGWDVKVILRDYQCDYSAGASLIQSLKHIDDQIGWLRAIVISLGLNNLAESAWKTSRLSFVVDWFFNVSASLHRLASVQPAEQWDVFDVYSSVKVKARFEVWQLNRDIFNAPTNTDWYLGDLYAERYQRWVGLPLDLSLFTPSSLNPGQLVLLLAMIGAK